MFTSGDPYVCVVWDRWQVTDTVTMAIVSFLLLLESFIGMSELLEARPLRYKAVVDGLRECSAYFTTH